MDHAISYQHIVDEAGEAAYRLDRDIAALEAARANARLIAAAPELLEALRELSAAYKWMMNECEFAEQRLADDRFEAALESAGAAIARATGATP